MGYDPKQDTEDLLTTHIESTRPQPSRLRRVAVIGAAACGLALLGLAAFALWPQSIREASIIVPLRPESSLAPSHQAFSHPAIEAAWGALTGSGDVLHVIARVERETHEGAPEDYVVPVNTSRVEIWQDTRRGEMRLSRLQAVGDGWVSTQEELIQGPVWTIYQIGMTGPDLYEPMNVLRYDASLSGEGPNEPLSVEADLAQYRTSLATGTATYAGEAVTNGEKVHLFRYQLDDSSYSRETTVHVSVATNLPVRTDVRRLYVGADGIRRLAERGSVVFEVSETVARQDVPANTFELKYPDNIPVFTSLTLDLERARNAQGVTPMWLGPLWNGLELAKDIPYSSTTGAKPEFSFDHGPPHGLSASDACAELGDYAKPKLDGPWITFEYGTMDGPNIRISSVPATSQAAWEEGFRGIGSWTTVDGARAFSTTRVYQFAPNGYSMGPPDRLEAVEGATRVEYRYLIVGHGDSTVVLQGYRVSGNELKKAAAALRSLD
ncbi:MAG: hypothetical protein Q8K89_12915 [Actinomycetota bacterium]|nr:hypothetical protein [Actinomycetota bacterium]